MTYRPDGDVGSVVTTLFVIVKLEPEVEFQFLKASSISVC
jgi:hypothetical protein